MKWTWPFGNPAREAKTAWPLAMLSEQRAANWGARDAGALIRDGYLRNAVAYRCVRMVTEAAAREIVLALGVPPILLGIPGDNTYANYWEASLALWRMTVLPLAARVAEALSSWLDGGFGEDVEVSLDLDRVQALATEREALRTCLEDATFLTRDEKRALAGPAP
jgi:phage portal protein BeeE